MIEFKKDITFEEYNELRRLVGWGTISERQFNTSIPNSRFITVGKCDGKTVSMARAVGDGGYHLLIVDVIVHPDFQGQGIGKEMLSQLMDFVKNGYVKKGETTMVSLLSAKGKEPFYEKMGFMRRPNDERGAGMSLFYTQE
ncbi:MAG: GNAT family N-acetyltransferase [Ruminiclostridium sp.]